MNSSRVRKFLGTKAGIATMVILAGLVAAGIMYWVHGRAGEDVPVVTVPSLEVEFSYQTSPMGGIFEKYENYSTQYYPGMTDPEEDTVVMGNFLVRHGDMTDINTQVRIKVAEDVEKTTLGDYVKLINLYMREGDDAKIATNLDENFNYYINEEADNPYIWEGTWGIEGYQGVPIDQRFRLVTQLECENISQADWDKIEQEGSNLPLHLVIEAYVDIE